MPGLLDIAPAAKRVMIPTSEGEAAVDVRGLSISDIRDLLARFPEVVGMLGSGNVKVADVMKLGPEIVGAIIAAATGYPGNEKAETFCKEIGAGVQAEVLAAAIKLTMPRGPGPFVDLLKAAGVDFQSLSATVSRSSRKNSSTGTPAS